MILGIARIARRPRVPRCTLQPPRYTEPGAADKGNLVHDALADFLLTWTGPFDDSAVKALTEIGEELFEPLDAFPAIRALWWPRFQKIAAGFVAYEARRSQLLFCPCGERLRCRACHESLLLSAY